MLIGFLAQLIDGALGMAYGITASSILLGTGLPPVTVSATVHAAECFSTGASAISHKAFGNVHTALFRKLLLPAMAGAAIGAYLLTNIPTNIIKPMMAIYLMVMGAVIIIKAMKSFPQTFVSSHPGPVGFLGAFMDAVGGGGWGAIVATNLIAKGNDVRQTVGTVNAVEFFVTLTASITFFLTIGLDHWNIIAALALGGFIAAPLGAWVCKKVPAKPMMIIIGCTVMALSAYTLTKIF